MISKQPMHELNIFLSRQQNCCIKVLIVTVLITQNTKFIIKLSNFLQSFPRPFCLKHLLRKKAQAFPLNSSNDALIVFLPYVN